MRRPGQFSEPGVNSYGSSQMQHMSAQRMQQGSGANHFPGRPDALPSDEEHPYISSKAEGQWQWDRDGPKGSNQMSSHIFEGKCCQRGDASRSFYQGQRLDPKIGLEKQANNDQRAQAHEQDMEIGYEESPYPQTFEGLEKKFHDDIMKLTKEQDEAEDAENARHRETIGEINAKYHVKLTALRAQHASRRDDFLRRESQARQNHYQQAGMSHYPNTTGLNDPHGYGGPTAAAVAAAAAEAAVGEGRRAYAAGSQFDSYRERAQYLEEARNHGFESTTRGPYPGGRVYNNNARYY
ncbi:hypothetical protein BVC80_1289g117 [Macleaya cordata]|uniref:Uncharacterized protein n=1 Tax=Macleaya cordata TaxID=56857 RepID=A0A200Q9Q4_MACCD|nr:hypothetical protein BVC80_1289g117 [Macleaya cordata]